MSLFRCRNLPGVFALVIVTHISIPALTATFVKAEDALPTCEASRALTNAWEKSAVLYGIARSKENISKEFIMLKDSAADDVAKHVSGQMNDDVFDARNKTRNRRGDEISKLGSYLLDVEACINDARRTAPAWVPPEEIIVDCGKVLKTSEAKDKALKQLRLASAFAGMEIGIWVDAIKSNVAKMERGEMQPTEVNTRFALMNTRINELKEREARIQTAKTCVAEIAAMPGVSLDESKPAQQPPSRPADDPAPIAASSADETVTNAKLRFVEVIKDYNKIMSATKDELHVYCAAASDLRELAERADRYLDDAAVTKEPIVMEKKTAQAAILQAMQRRIATCRQKNLPVSSDEIDIKLRAMVDSLQQLMNSSVATRKRSVVCRKNNQMLDIVGEADVLLVASQSLDYELPSWSDEMKQARRQTLKSLAGLRANFGELRRKLESTRRLCSN
jgi:hypothetical protein